LGLLECAEAKKTVRARELDDTKTVQQSKEGI
jgi:hypothetical protein